MNYRPPFGSSYYQPQFQRPPFLPNHSHSPILSPYLFYPYHTAPSYQMRWNYPRHHDRRWTHPHSNDTRQTRSPSSHITSQYNQCHYQNGPPKRPTVVVNSSMTDSEKIKYPFCSILSYNLLAQDLIHRNKFLYRVNKPESLQWDYRKEQLLNDLISSKVHVMCLQEVEDRHYDEWYLPQLKSKGYEGIYQKRTGKHLDGCAMFYQTSHLQLLEHHIVQYQMNTGTLNRDNVGLVAKFRLSSSSSSSTKHDNTFCVATTHILYNPKAGEVKLAQICYLLAELHKMATDTHTGDLLPCILCGDFNSLPNSPMLQLLLEGMLDYSSLSAWSVSGYRRSANKYRPIPVPLLPRSLGIGQDCSYSRKYTIRSDDVTGTSTSVINEDSRLHKRVHSKVSMATSCNEVIFIDDKKDVIVIDEQEISYKSEPDQVSISGKQHTSVHVKYDEQNRFTTDTVINPLEIQEPKLKRIKTDQLEVTPTHTLTHPFKFDSAYPMPRKGEHSPTVTTYHMSACETVDYILYTPTTKRTPGFHLVSRQALPSLHTLHQLGPQPNSVLSSDHLFLQVDLQLVCN